MKTRKKKSFINRVFSMFQKKKSKDYSHVDSCGSYHYCFESDTTEMPQFKIKIGRGA